MSWVTVWDISRTGDGFEEILSKAFGNCTSFIKKDNIDSIINAHNEFESSISSRYRTYLSRENIYKYYTNFRDVNDLGIEYNNTYYWNSNKIEMKLMDK